MNQSINYGGVCRTAPATPGLLKIAWEGDIYIYIYIHILTDISTTRPNRPSGPILWKLCFTPTAMDSPTSYRSNRLCVNSAHYMVIMSTLPTGQWACKICYNIPRTWLIVSWEVGVKGNIWHNLFLFMNMVTNDLKITIKGGVSTGRVCYQQGYPV